MIENKISMLVVLQVSMNLFPLMKKSVISIEDSSAINSVTRLKTFVEIPLGIVGSSNSIKLNRALPMISTS